MVRQFWRFAIAGAIGFLVDAGVLYLALWLGSGYYLGRVISFLCAAFTTWQINRRHAFKAEAGEKLLHEWLRYLLAMLGGGLLNYGVYALLVFSLPPAPWLPLLAVAAGSIAGLAVNFLSAKFWVFRRKSHAPRI